MDRDVTLNVDELVSKFKKEGHFDRLRKQILETVNEKVGSSIVSSKIKLSLFFLTIIMIPMSLTLLPY